MGTYLREAYVLPLLLCAPLVFTLLLMQAWFVPHTYAQLAVHLFAAGLVYGAGMAWAFAAYRLTAFSQSPTTRLEVTDVAVAVDNVL